MYIHRSSSVRDNDIELKKNIGKIKTLLHHIENNSNEMLKQKTKSI